MLALPTSGLLGKSLNDFHLEASWGLQPLVEKFNNCWQGKKTPPETSNSLNFSNCTAEIKYLVLFLTVFLILPDPQNFHGMRAKR